MRISPELTTADPPHQLVGRDPLLCVYGSAVPEALFAHSAVNVAHSLHHGVTTLVPLQAVLDGEKVRCRSETCMWLYCQLQRLALRTASASCSTSEAIARGTQHSIESCIARVARCDIFHTTPPSHLVGRGSLCVVTSSKYHK